MASHVEAPWRLADDGRSVVTADGTVLAPGVSWPLERIVACVNALAGIPTGALEFTASLPTEAERLMSLAAMVRGQINKVCGS